MLKAKMPVSRLGVQHVCISDKDVVASPANMRLDKSAASRFIKHAIASQSASDAAEAASGPAATASPSEPVEIGHRSRLKVFKTQSEALASTPGPSTTDSDEDLVVHQDDDAQEPDTDMKAAEEEPKKSKKDKKRPREDPLAGSFFACPSPSFPSNLS
jgi:hypothetical protein